MATGLPAWAYVDERRTHEVRAGVRRGPPLAFVVRERALGSRDPAEAYEETHVLAEPWEWRMHQMALEARLALLGRYFRATAAQQGWQPLAAPPPGRALDLAPLQLGDGVRFEFHHYAAPGAPHAVTLVGIPQPGERMGLARLDYQYPDVHGGNLSVVHPKLPLPVYRSVLAGLHLELLDLGERKVGRDDGSIAGDERGWAALQACLDAILERLSQGRLGKPGEAPREAGPFLASLSRLEQLDLQRRVADASTRARSFETQDEIGLEHATSVAARKGEVLIDDVSSDVLEALGHPRLAALLARFLAPGEGDRLVEDTSRAIRDAMKKKRAAARADEQHLLSIVEAALLVRNALAKRGTRLDKETLDTLRHAPAYL